MMIAFEMTADNFDTYLGGGTPLGTRLADAGLQLAMADVAADADTLALWLLHEQSWADASGNGWTLSPSGTPLLTDEGMAANGGYAATDDTWSFGGLTDLTVEAWVRWEGPDNLSGVNAGIVTSSPDADNRVRLYLSPGTSRVRLTFWVETAGTAVAQTQELDAATLQALRADSGAHLALTVHLAGAASHAVTYVNGQVLQDRTVTLSAWDDVPGRVYVGSLEGGSLWQGLIDAVRISRTVRYDAPFDPLRYAATGTFTSPSFDSLRQGAQWLPLEWMADVPSGAGAAFDVRCADVLNGGDVDAAWQDAAMADAPGRYQQWRVTLSRGDSGRDTPTVQAVTATAGRNGVNLYHGTGAEAARIDYDTPIARFGPQVDSATVADLAAPAVHWFALRSTTVEGEVSRTVDAELSLELAADGALAAPRPAPVEALEALGAGSGRARLSWAAASEMGDAPAATFTVFSNGGSGPVDFQTPLATLDAEPGRTEYQWTSDPQVGGATVIFAVRAKSAAGAVDAAPAEVSIAIDATTPAAPGHVSGLTVLSD